MELITILIAIFSLFVIIGIGFAARRYGILNGDRVHLISHVLVNVALPAITISSMQVPDTAKTMGIVDSMLLVAGGYYLAAFLISILICQFLPSTPAKQGSSSSCWSFRTPCSWASRWRRRSSAPFRSFM